MTNRTCELSACSAPHRARGLCSTHYNQRIAGEARRHPRETRTCVVCASAVTRRQDNKHQPTCSVQCRTIVQIGKHQAPTSDYAWRTDAARRARAAGAPVLEHFDRETVFDQDGWVCQVCDVDCVLPDPYRLDAATVDHVVPLALGGPHSLSNAQTLCLSCNSRKQARICGIAPAA